MNLDKAYENAINDEHYHREMFQKRLGYHTNVVLVALGAVIAALIEAEREWVLRLLGLALLVTGVFALATPGMIRRIYEHFIEHLDVRERLEVALGLRDPKAVADSMNLSKRLGVRPSIAQPSTPSFKAGYLFHESWIRSGRGRSYFRWMTLMFNGLGSLAILTGGALLVFPSSLGLLPDPPDKSDALGVSTVVVERHLGSVGPFERGETCVTTATLAEQIASIADRAQAAGALQIIVVGSADQMPVAESRGDSFGTNTGVALARARCVAGWIAEGLARRETPSIIDVRVRDAGVRTAASRIAGAAEDRVVEVLMLMKLKPNRSERQ